MTRYIMAVLMLVLVSCGNTSQAEENSTVEKAKKDVVKKELSSTASEKSDPLELGERYIEAAGGYSMCAPKGWEFKDSPASKFKIISGPKTNDFQPNINFVIEKSTLDLTAYTDANEAALGKHFDNYKKVSRSDFVTTGGLKGIKLTILDRQFKTDLRQSFYIFFGPESKKFLVIATSPAESGDSLDALFDSSVKTFKLE